MTKVLKISILCGLCATLFVPFIVLNQFFFPFITAKGFVFKIIIELAFALWILLALIDVSYRPKKSWLLYSFGIFVVVIAIADFFGVNFYRSFWSNYERMEGLVTLLHLYVYFLMLGTIISTEKLWHYFFNIALGANTILCLFYGLPQIFGKTAVHQSIDRLDATLGNATYFAAYLMIHIFIALFLLARSGKIYERILYGLSIALQLYLLYFTQTRGALLGLIGGLCIATILVAIFERERKVFRKIAFGGIGLIVVVIFTFFLIKDTAFVQKSPTMLRFAQISLSENFLKSQGRYYIWPMAIKGFKERPILGWGQENFNYVFNKNYDPLMWGQEQWFDRTHNVILDWLIAGGLLGLISYLSIFIALLYYIWRGRGGLFSVTDKALLTGLISAYFFQNLFVFDNLTSYILFMILIAYVYAIRTPSDAPTLISQKPLVAPVVFQSIIVFVSLATLCTLYFVNVKPMKANMAILDGLAAEANGSKDYLKNVESLKRSIGYNTFGKAEAREQLVLLSQRINLPDVPQDIRMKAFEAASMEMKKQIDENPEPDARYALFLGSLLSRYGAFDDALKYLKEANKLSPKKQSILIEIAEVYRIQKKFPEAFAILKEAFDLDPTFVQVRLLYTLSAFENGNIPLTKELFATIDPNTLIFNDQAIMLFLQTKQFDTMIGMLKKRVEINPVNPQYRLSLAAGYIEAGQRDLAIKTLEDFIALDPVKFKEQGEFYIKEIKAGRNP